MLLQGGFLNTLCVAFPLHLQDSSGMRLWKRKWFVLSDYCLFYYKGEFVHLAKSEMVLIVKSDVQTFSDCLEGKIHFLINDSL